MNKQKAIGIASALFPTYPSVKAFHVTHDGQAFEKEQDATAHAGSFPKTEEQVVTTVTRDECEASTGDDATPHEKAQQLLEKEKSKLTSLEAAAEGATGAAKEKALKAAEKQREKVAAAEQAVADISIAE